MSQGGAPVGTAFVEVLPKTDGFVATLTGQLKSAISQAAGGIDASPIAKSLNAGLIALGGAAIAGIYKGIKATQDWVTEVQTLQRVTGQTTEGASTLAATADAMGVSVSSLSSAMTILSRNVATNSTGIQKYGIATRDAAGNTLPMDQILAQIQQKFQELPPGVDRTALATSLFGRAGRALIPVLGLTQDQMAEMANKAKDLGLVLSQNDVDAAQKLKIAQAELGDAFKGLSIQLGKVFIPVLTAMTKGLTAVVEVIGRIPVPLKVAVVGFLALNTAMFAGRVAFKLLADNLATLTGALGTNKDAVASSTDAFNAHAAAVGDTSSMDAATASAETNTGATEANTEATGQNTTITDANSVSTQVNAAASQIAATATLEAAGATTIWSATMGLATGAAEGLGAAIVSLGEAVGSVIAAIDPIALVIRLAILGITYLVIKNWTAIKNATVEIWNGIKGAVAAAWNAIKAAISAAVNFIGPAVSAVGNALKSVWDAVLSAFSAVGQALGQVVNVIGQAFQRLAQVAGPALELIAKVAGAAIVGLIVIQLYALAAVLKIVAVAIQIAGKIIAVVIGAAAKVLRVFANVGIDIFNAVATAVNFLASVFVTFWNIVGPIVTGIGKLIASVFGTYLRASFAFVGAIISAVIAVFQAFWSVVVAVFGPPLIAIFNAVKTVVGAVAQFLSTVWQKVSDAFKTVVNAVIDGVNLLIKAWNELPGHDDVQLIPTLSELTDKQNAATAAAQDGTAAVNDQAAAMDNATHSTIDWTTALYDGVQNGLKGISSLRGAFNEFQHSTGIDMSKYRTDLKTLIQDPSKLTLDSLRQDLHGIQQAYAQWKRGIASTFGDVSQLLNDFFTTHKEGMLGASQSLEAYARKLGRFSGDIKSIYKEWGDKAQGFISIAQQIGPSALPGLEKFKNASHTAQQRFLQDFSGVKTEAQQVADALGKSLGDAFNKVVDKFKVMINYIATALKQPLPYPKIGLDDSQAQATLRNLKVQLVTLGNTSYHVDIYGHYHQIAGGPGGIATGGIIAGAVGMIATSPTYLVGEGHYPTPAGPGAEAVIPLNQRGRRIMRDTFGDLWGGGGTKVALPSKTEVDGSLTISDWRNGIATLDSEIGWEEAVRTR